MPFFPKKGRYKLPYIEQEKRADAEVFPQNSGELNYALTCIVIEYLGDQPRYKDFNDVVGALEACKLELYRKMVSPYEDAKERENGPVYPAEF